MTALEVVEVEHDQAERLVGEDAPAEPVLERAVVQEAGQVVGLGADLDRAVDLGVLEGDRDLGGEQLDELELLLACSDGSSPSRSSVRTPVAPSRPRSGTQIRLPSIGPASRNWRTRGSLPLVEDEGRLVVGDDPGREALLAGQPRLHVLGGVDALGGQRPEQAASSRSRSSIERLS